MCAEVSPQLIRRFSPLLALVVLAALVGCDSDGLPTAAAQEPTADTGPLRQSTTGGDAAGTLNLPLHTHEELEHKADASDDVTRPAVDTGATEPVGQEPQIGVNPDPRPMAPSGEGH